MKKLIIRGYDFVKEFIRTVLVLFGLRSGDLVSTPSNADLEVEGVWKQDRLIKIDPTPFGKIAWRDIKEEMGPEFCRALSAQVTKQIKEIDEHFKEADYGLDAKFYTDEIVRDLLGGSISDYFWHRLVKRGYAIRFKDQKILIVPNTEDLVFEYEDDVNGTK